MRVSQKCKKLVKMKTLWILTFSIQLYYLYGSPVDSNESSSAVCFGYCQCSEDDFHLSVICGDGDMTSMPSFTHNPKVKTLDLSHNNLTQIPEHALDKFLNLENLNLNGNDIHLLNFQSTMSLRYLESLSLENNGMTHLDPHSFINNPSLTTLSLAGNHLQELFGQNRAFLSSPSVEFLDLSQCGLESVSSRSFAELDNLLELDLTGNLLETLSADALDPLVNLKRVYLRGNPWQCGSELDDLIRRKKELLADRSRLYCLTQNGERRKLFEEEQREVTEDSWNIDHSLNTNDDLALNSSSPLNNGLPKLDEVTLNFAPKIIGEPKIELPLKQSFPKIEEKPRMNDGPRIEEPPLKNGFSSINYSAKNNDGINKVRDIAFVKHSLPLELTSQTSELKEEQRINSSFSYTILYLNLGLLAALLIMVVVFTTCVCTNWSKKTRKHLYENVDRKTGNVILIPNYNNGYDEAAASQEPLYERVEYLEIT